MTRDLLSDGWLDVSRPVTAGMVHWPGDPEVEVELISDMSRGDSCNVSYLKMCAHCGTHVDAPCHFLRAGAGVDAAPLSILMGSVRVLSISDPVSVRRAELEAYDIQEGQRIIFRTHNVSIPWAGPFQMDFVHIALDAAEYLAERKVALVGIDYMSVGGFYQDMAETHLALLNGGIWIVENLDLREITEGDWELICLPLKLVGTDGAPARALMRKTSPAT